MGLLANLPVLNLVNCFLCLWIWLGGALAVYLYRRFHPAGAAPTVGQGALIGIVAGIIAAVVGLFVFTVTGAISMPIFSGLARTFGVEGDFASPTLGFGEFLDLRRASGERRLFPEFERARDDGSWSKQFSKHFKRFRESIGVTRRGVKFHSLRHNVEDALRNADVTSLEQRRMPSDKFALPSRYLRMDPYGNVPRGQITQILSRLRATTDVTQRRSGSRRSSRKRIREDYFVGKPGGGRLPFGIYQRATFAFGSSVRPVFLFGKQPVYRKRLRFFEVAQEIADRELTRQYSIAFYEAMRTAR
jgi:hypothetical protein